MSLDHSPNWVIPPTLVIMQPEENEFALGNAYPWLLNLNHSPNWAIPLELIIVQPGENDFSLGNDCLDHFLMEMVVLH